MATGLQGHFDWAGVALGAAAGAAIGAVNLGGSGGRIVSGMAGALAGGATRSLIDGSDFGDNVLAALPDVIGNTVGGALADAVSERGSVQRKIGRALDAPATEAEKQAVLAELNKSGGVGSFEWGGANPQAELQQAVLARLRMEQLATTKLGSSAKFQQIYQDFLVALADMDTYSAESNPKLLGADLRRVDNSAFLKGVTLSDASGYKAHLYYDSKNDRYIFANAGSDSPTDAADVTTDKGLIGTKRLPQLDTAQENAFTLLKNGTPNLVFSGHSLGGALAVLQSLSVGRPAVTFNSAPFTKTIGEAYAVDLGRAADLVRNYHVANDPLTWLNNHPRTAYIAALAANAARTASDPLSIFQGPVAGVNPRDLLRLAPPPGASITLPAAADLVAAHSMASVLNGFAGLAGAR